MDIPAITKLIAEIPQARYEYVDIDITLLLYEICKLCERSGKNFDAFLGGVEAHRIIAAL